MAFLKGLDLGKIMGAVESGVKSAKDGLSKIDLEGVVQGAKEAVASGVDAVGGAIDRITGKEEAGENPSFKEFISLLWYLASVDGVVSEEEKETLGQLAASLDESYGEYASELETECLAKLDEGRREFGAQDAAKIEAQKIVEALKPSMQDAKLLCWNLLALANSDAIDEHEIDFIRFVSEKSGVSASVFEELRNYSDAIVEIGRSRENLRTSNRSYAEIEPLVNELADREQTILRAAQALVADR